MVVMVCALLGEVPSFHATNPATERAPVSKSKAEDQTHFSWSA